MYFDQPKIVPMQCGKRDTTKKDHWEKLDISEYKISKPTVLCFGGNRTFDPKDANAFCKSAEELLLNNSVSKDIDRNDYDLVGFCYGHYPLKNQTEISRLENEEAQIIEKRLLRPLYLNKNGKPLSVEKTEKNFNLLTVFCHSYGSIAFDKVIHYAYENMTECGFSYEQISKIMSQIICVSYAPRSLIGGVSSIQIISGCDGYDIPENASKKMRNTYFSRFYKYFDTKNMWGNGTQIANKNTLGVYTTNMTNEEFMNDHCLQVLMDGGNDKVRYSSENAKSIFYVAQQSLALSVKNSVENFKTKNFQRKPDINKLYSKAKYILGKRQIDLEHEM